MPKVSILVPVYNVEQYLQECLESLINQTLKEIEIICINDGSTDNSPQILKDYERKDSRIKVINKQNSGYGHTMNVGLDNATGEYIGIVESDDYVALDMYETLYNTAQKYDVDFIKADFFRFFVEEDGLKLEYNELARGKVEYYNRVLNPAENLDVFRFIMNTWSGIYKNEFIKKYNIRHNETPGASYQDNGFFFQTFCRASKVYFLNKPFYMNRRDNPNSSIKSKDKVYCMSNEYRYIKDFLNKNLELKAKFIYVYSIKKYHNFLFTYNRVAEEHKRSFIKHFSAEFKKAQEDGELDKSLFWEKEWNTLNRIIDDPEAFHFETLMYIEASKQRAEIRRYRDLYNVTKKKFKDAEKYIKLYKESQKNSEKYMKLYKESQKKSEKNMKLYKESQKKLNRIFKSHSYKIGRGITFLPRKLRNSIRPKKIDEVPNQITKSTSLKVSVILPVHNAEPFLRQCLESVIHQTLSDIEIICINDGSTDGSLAILKEYAAKDLRISIIDQENRFAGVARNRGLEVTKGEYLSFLDADDFFELTMLEDAYTKCKQSNADFVVFRSDHYFNDDNRYESCEWTIKKHLLPQKEIFNYHDIERDVFKLFNGWAWDKLYKRDFVISHNLTFQDQRTTNDLYFVFSALVEAERISTINRVLAHHRKCKNDSLSVTREKSLDCFYNALIALRNKLMEMGIYEEVKQSYINYALHFSLWNLNTINGPSREILYNKLREEYFDEFCVTKYPEDYFYNKSEHSQYLEIINNPYVHEVVL